jgi:flagellar basal-body rod protein FlgG
MGEVLATGLLELGEILLTTSERRLEVVSRNVANTTTPGFKAGKAFEETLAHRVSDGAASLAVATDFAQGALRRTGGAFDLAISGAGFFMVRSEAGTYYTRAGQFERSVDGRLKSSQGLALQTEDGGDLIVTSARPEILEDGTVLEDGLPVARIGVFQSTGARPPQAIGGTLFLASEADMQTAASPLVRQGMLENANVDMASQMLAMRSAVRQAEIGARVVQTYDSLIGQSISTFGKTSR